MCTASYCDHSCNGPDDCANDYCNRPAGNRRCGFVLESDGSCRACGTEACSICGDVMAPGVAVDMPDPETGKPLRLCGPCAVEVKADAAEVEAEGRRLLNGRSPREEGLDVEEDETCETVIDANPLTLDEAIADLTRRGEAA